MDVLYRPAMEWCSWILVFHVSTVYCFQEQKSSEAKESCSGGVGGTSKVVDAATSSLKSQLASITEKVTEEYKAKASQKPANQSEIEARKAVKAAVMAQ